MAGQAKQYHSRSSFQYKSGLYLLDLLDLKAGDHVLDLGCGTGNVTYDAAKRVGTNGKVVGIDPDQERISCARKNYGHVENLLFVEGRADAQNLPEGPYDVVFTNIVLHWIKDKKSVFESAYRSLKVGGRFGITLLLHLPSTLEQLSLLMDPAHARALMGEFNFEPVEFHEQLAISCGFSVQKIQMDAPENKFANTDSLYKWWNATTQGKFDLAFIEKSALEEFEKQFATEEINVKESTEVLILQK